MWNVDLSPFLTQTVKTQNPMNGELSPGSVAQAVHQGVQAGRRTAAGIGGIAGRPYPSEQRTCFAVPVCDSLKA